MRKLLYGFVVAVMVIAVVIPISACSIPTPPQQFAVTFNLMGGNGVTIPSQIVGSGSTAERPNDDPTRTGFTFQGWFTASSGGAEFNFNSPIIAPTVIYARWEAVPRERVLVNFDTRQGSFIPAELVYEGDTVPRPADPMRDGYIFQGWFAQVEGGESFNFNNSITAATTIFARWIEEPSTVSAALRAVPMATDATSRDPVVIESYVDVDARRNRYLISVGRVQNQFISTIGMVHFNGITPMTFSRTDVTETTITESLSRTVSDSVTTSDTQSHTAGIQASWERKFPVAGTFRVQLNYSWTGSWTNTTVNQNSLTTNTSEAQRVSNSTSVGFTVGNHGEAAGWYRIALYSAIDIFFAISTSLDNQELLSWEVVTVARSEFFPHFEFSPTPQFDNSPEIGTEIELDDYFYTRLPIPPLPELKFVQVSAGFIHTMAINTWGELWAWGNNGSGRLGLGDTVNRNIPTRVGSQSNWVMVSASYNYTMAINSLGELWAWGGNGNRQLGLGDTNNRYVPVRVGAATNWSMISTGDYHVMAINTLGELWTWGSNDVGQLGFGDTTSRSVPVRLGTATNWAMVSVGFRHTMAINALGELWAWGQNISGQLGIGSSNNNRHTPVRVGTATNWRTVSAGFSYTTAINTLGELWSWGWNRDGQLGLGHANNRNAPTRVGTATNWLHVSSGVTHVMAINALGELWSWGSNHSGRLGLGHTSNRNVPTRVGGAIGWSYVSAGSHTAKTNTSGELWVSGPNNHGQLGDGTLTNRHSPVRISEPWL